MPGARKVPTRASLLNVLSVLVKVNVPVAAAVLWVRSPRTEPPDAPPPVLVASDVQPPGRLTVAPFASSANPTSKVLSPPGVNEATTTELDPSAEDPFWIASANGSPEVAPPVTRSATPEENDGSTAPRALVVHE